MEIPIRAVGTHSAISERAFVPGDRVWSYLYRGGDGEVERADVLEDERDQLDIEGGILCKWSQVIKKRDTSEAEVRKAALQSTDEIFLSLYDEADETDDTPETRATRDRLKFFLALQLERKRVLKPIGRGHYRHMPTKREFEVPQLELTPELVAAHLKPEGDVQSDLEDEEKDDTEVVAPEDDRTSAEGPAPSGPGSIKTDSPAQ